MWIEELFTGSYCRCAKTQRKPSAFFKTYLYSSPNPKGIQRLHKLDEDWRPGGFSFCDLLICVQLVLLPCSIIFPKNLLTLSLASSHCTTEAFASDGWFGSQLVATKYLGLDDWNLNFFSKQVTNAKNKGFVRITTLWPFFDLYRWREL